MLVEIHWKHRQTGGGIVIITGMPRLAPAYFSCLNCRRRRRSDYISAVGGCCAPTCFHASPPSPGRNGRRNARGQIGTRSISFFNDLAIQTTTAVCRHIPTYAVKQLYYSTLPWKVLGVFFDRANPLLPAPVQRSGPWKLADIVPRYFHVPLVRSS